MNNAFRYECLIIKTIENQMAVVGTLNAPRPDTSQFLPAWEARTSQAWVCCQSLQGGLNGVDVSFRHFGTGLIPVSVNLF